MSADSQVLPTPHPHLPQVTRAVMGVATSLLLAATLGGCAGTKPQAQQRSAPQAAAEAASSGTVTNEPANPAVAELAQRVREFTEALDPTAGGASGGAAGQSLNAPVVRTQPDVLDPDATAGVLSMGPASVGSTPPLDDPSTQPASPPVVVVSTAEPLGSGTSPVSPASPTAAPEAAENLPAPSPEPLPAEPPVASTSSPARLAERIRQRLEASPTSAANVLDYELLRLLDTETGPAAEADPVLAGSSSDLPTVAGDLGSEDQRILASLAHGLGEFRRTLRQAEMGPAPLPSEKIRPLVEMSRELRRQVGLTLPAVALCSEVSSFGNYKVMPTTFSAGRKTDTILYVEVDHFGSQSSADGWWETKLSLSATLYDEQGQPVLSLPESPAVDRSRQKRRDFFLCHYLTLPATTAPGEYILKITVKDELTHRVAEQSVKLTFGK